jgi:hypothetical protein
VEKERECNRATLKNIFKERDDHGTKSRSIFNGDFFIAINKALPCQVLSSTVLRHQQTSIIINVPTASAHHFRKRE